MEEKKEPMSEKLVLSDEIIRLFECKKKIPGASSTVNSLCFSKDDRQLFAGSNNETVSYFDTTTGKKLQSLHNAENGVSHVRYLDDTNTILCASTISIKRMFPYKCIIGIAKIMQWSLEDNRITSLFLGHNAEITDIEVNADHTLFASCGLDKAARIWSLKEQKLLAVFQSAISASFDPSSPLLAVAYEASDVSFFAEKEGVKAFINLHRLDNSLETPLATFTITQAALSKIQFSPNGMQILCYSKNGVLILDAFTGMPINWFEAKAELCDVMITPDSRYLIIGSEKGDLEVFHIMKGHLVENFKHAEKSISCLRFGHKHLIMASACQDIALWLPR